MFTNALFSLAFIVAAQAGTPSISSVEPVAINRDAPVVCSHSILIQASPAEVWTVLTDIDQWATWQTDIAEPKLNGPLAANTPFVWKTGGAGIRSVLHTVDTNRSFGWTGKTYGMRAVHNWTLTEENGMTRVSVEESMEGLLAGLLKKSFNQNLERDMQHWLELLKAQSEI